MEDAVRQIVLLNYDITPDIQEGNVVIQGFQYFISSNDGPHMHRQNEHIPSVSSIPSLSVSKLVCLLVHKLVCRLVCKLVCKLVHHSVSQLVPR